VEESHRVDDELRSKAKEFSECLLELIAGMGPVLHEELLGEVATEEAKLWRIQLDLTYLCLHLIDRLTFQTLGAEKRQVFIDALGPAVEQSLENQFHAQIESREFRDAFFQILNRKNVEYAAYREFFPEEGQGTKNTLFWEFAKNMSTDYGNLNPIRLGKVWITASRLMEPLVEALRIFGLVPRTNAAGDGVAWNAVSSERLNKEERCFRDKPYESLLKIKSTWPPARKFDKEKPGKE